MPQKTPPILSIETARNLWVHHAGLATPTGGSLGELIATTGWLRALGGVDPYLAMQARRPEVSVQDACAALESGELCITPAVRNSIHVVPATQRLAALAEAAAVWEVRGRADRESADISQGELEQTSSEVLDTLSTPLSTDQLRAELAEGAIRDLGEQGREVGISSTLMPALHYLEFTDRIRRRPVENRLDTDQYCWTAVGDPAPDTRPATQRRADLVGNFATATGPVSLAQIASWLGDTEQVAGAAVAGAGLHEVELEGHGPAWVTREQYETAAHETASGSDQVAPDNVHLLGFEDLALVSHSPGAWFDPSHHGIGLPVWGKGSHTLGGAHHLAMRTVLIGNHMGGFWAWNPDTRAVEVEILELTNAATTGAIDEAAERVTHFLRSEFGNARMTSIDSESTERARLDALRTMVS